MGAAAKPATRAKAPKARMSLAEAMGALEAAGSEQTRKTWRRHGAREPMFGVSFATLKALLKKIGVDHELALGLWDSGNYDARNLAYKVADPSRLSVADLDRWAREGCNFGCTGYAAALARESGHGLACVQRWLAADAVALRAAGWSTVAELAFHDTALVDEWFAERLREIETSIHSAHNDQRYAMNHALVAIGCRNPALRAAATAAAGRIGNVAIDLGDTACKVPVAAQSITKAWEHSLPRGYDSPAAHERSREPMRLRC